MTTTTRTTLETDKVVGEPGADPAVEQQGKTRDETAPVDGSPRAAGEAQLVTRRGRQRTPKPWLSVVMCRLGMHDGQWAYAAKGNCTQGRECERCGSVHVRARHQREWRYIRAGSCEQVRKCGRCSDANGERTSHKWGEDYDIETRWWQGSREGHRCLRCGVVEEWTVNDGD